MKKLSLFLLSIFFISNIGYAQNVNNAGLQKSIQQLTQLVQGLKSEVSGLKQTVKTQNETIKTQAMRLNELEKGKGSTYIVPKSASPVSLTGISQNFNPDFGLVGVTQAKLLEPTTEDGEGNDTIALKELELNIGADVDPFSRFDAVITFNDEIEEDEGNVEIEEAYYTRWGLPFDFTARIGKFRSKVGRANRLHIDQLENTEHPLVIQNFFGEHGLGASGVRLENTFDILGAAVTVTGEVLRGNNGDAFSGISRRPIINTRVESFFELSDSLQMTLGGNWLLGDENAPGLAKGDDRFGVHVFGTDLTFEWFLEEGKKLKLQNELFIQDRSSFVATDPNPWGFYTLLDYVYSNKWSGGVRYDLLQPQDASNVGSQTWGVSPYITFNQSEFANYTLQFSHTEHADGEEENAVILEATFLIGKHEHPVA